MSHKPSYEELEQRVEEFKEEAARRKQAEEALRESEEQFRKILETAPIGVGISQIESGKIVFSNGRIAEMRGRPIDEYVGSSTKNYWVDIEQRKEFVEIFRKKGRVPSREIQFKRQDGSIHWSLLTWESIWYGGEKCILYWVYDINTIKQAEEVLRQDRDEMELRVEERTRDLQREITERKQAEKALRESEEKYRTLVENANDAIFIAQDGVIKFPSSVRLRIK